ncbi:MAG: flavodoxin family protein [Candidatus Hydrogenedentes bacterium]|nr:flavodoxin family protein [Candidatus Hydrogenedentota bacterium]
MGTPVKVTAIVGTYCKGGVIDSAVDEILAAAKEEGAEATKVYLIDQHVEFCSNCRTCTQQEGEKRGHCPKEDDMAGLLDEIERSDAIVLASPMNFWSVTAVTKRFIERFVCYAYWPWGAGAPEMRSKRKNKRAIIVASSAAPALLARLHSRMVGLMKSAVDCLGARTIGVLFIGLAALEQNQGLTDRTRRRARALGKRLAFHA